MGVRNELGRQRDFFSPLQPEAKPLSEEHPASWVSQKIRFFSYFLPLVLVLIISELNCSGRIGTLTFYPPNENVPRVATFYIGRSLV